MNNISSIIPNYHYRWGLWVGDFFNCSLGRRWEPTDPAPNNISRIFASSVLPDFLRVIFEYFILHSTEISLYTNRSQLIKLIETNRAEIFMKTIVSLQNLPFWSDEATQFTYFKHISINVVIVSQNPPFWSDEVTQLPSYKHIESCHFKIHQFEAIKWLFRFKNSWKKSTDTIGRSASISEDWTVGTSPAFAPRRLTDFLQSVNLNFCYFSLRSCLSFSIGTWVYCMYGKVH
jgi:hypothetical protein